MLKFFTTLFIISIFAIIILHYGIQKEKTKNLLHDFKKSCNINSVRFEGNFKNFFRILKKIKHFLLKKRRLIFKKIHSFFENKFLIFKKKFRKKLFEQGEKKSVSPHIISIKSDINKQK